MNLAALRGLRYGVDVIWTTGPLAYLFQPLDLGNHLVHGLIAQGIVWLVLLGIAADLCFFIGAPLWNLLAFGLCVATAAPLFHFNYIGRGESAAAGGIDLRRLVAAAAIPVVALLPHAGSGAADLPDQRYRRSHRRGSVGRADPGAGSPQRVAASPDCERSGAGSASQPDSGCLSALRRHLVHRSLPAGPG